MKKLFLLLFLSISAVGISQLSASESGPQFIKGSDTLVVYSDVPGVTPSNKYTIRVRSAATNNEWVDVFVNFTDNKAVPGSLTEVNSPDKYQMNTAAWSHAYGNIEMNNGHAVEVEIAAKPGFKIGGKDFEKAKVHPEQKASAATLVGGKIYFTITKPGQIYIDINGQMDDYNRAINPIGHPVHVVTLWANPVIKKPTLTGNRVRTIESGTSLAAINAIDPSTYDTLYFKPGLHDNVQNIKVHPGKTIYIPGDAYLFGSLDNSGVPVGSYSKNGENITIYGYGTICGSKIPHYDLTPATDGYKAIQIENGKNYKVFGLTMVDHHSLETNGENGSYKWLKAITWRQNGDGIGGYTNAEDCFIRSQDDASYVKSNKKSCTFWKDSSAALFHMATVPENTTEPIIIEDCDVLYARLRYNPGYNGGGFMQRGEGTPGIRNVNVIFRNFRFHDKLINMPIINLVSSKGTAIGSSYKGILFQKISIAGMASGNKQQILGCAEAPWYGGLIFDNVTIGGTKVTTENYKTYFNTNEYVKYLLFNMPNNVTLTTIADDTKGTVTRNITQDTYLETSTVILTANGKPGYLFSHWSGDATGTSNPLSVVVDKNMSITANFTQPNFALPIVIEAPGSGSMTIPNGVDSVSIKVWAGGGAGGSASNDSIALQSRGGGGAGGSFASVTKKVTVGQVLSYTLGAGGMAAPLGFANLSVDSVQNGGSSKVSLDSEMIALALGGSGGKNIASAFSSGAGGVVTQTGNVGDIVFYGGNGGNATSTGAGGGGGSAGSLGNGGNGGIASAPNAGLAGAGGGADGGKIANTTNAGSPGAVPGAGGSGANVRAVKNTSLKGGNGANGKIIFSFKLLTDIKIVTDLNKTIEIYPNPATDKLFFNSEDKLISKVQLVDLTGKIVFSTNVKLQNGSVDLKGIAKGMYLVKLHADNFIFTKKIWIK